MVAADDEARSAVIDTLAAVVTARWLTHPTRVAVDGRSAAGKTAFADDLASAVAVRGREILRASIDDFHRPGHKGRSQRGEWTPQSYYDEGYDYEAFREVLLRPLGPGGSRRCRTAIFDSFHDVALSETWRTVSDEAVAIVDGAFLLRPDFVEHWDYIIWLDIDMETMVAWARRRDVAWVGSEDVVEQRYRRHWIPTHELYERLTGAPERAHALIDNRDVRQPRLLRLSPL